MPDNPQTKDTDSKPKRRFSRTAFLSLVLAIVPHVWVFIIAPRLGLSLYRPAQLYGYIQLPLLAAAVASIVLAFVSDARIRRSGGALRGRALALIAVPLAYFACLLSLVYPAFLRADVSAPRTECKWNLKQVGLALLMYALDNEGRFPETLQMLVDEDYLKDARVFACPCVLKRGTAFDPHNVDDTGDYCYARVESDEANPLIPFVWDRPGNHQPPAANVLFVDGHVEWVVGEKLPALVDEYTTYYVLPPEKLRSFLDKNVRPYAFEAKASSANDSQSPQPPPSPRPSGNPAGGDK